MKLPKSKELALTIPLAGMLALLLCVYQSCVVLNCDFSGMSAERFGIDKFWKFFLFFEAILIACTAAGRERLFRYRYPIAIVCFIICVALEITGSSIGCFIGGSESNLQLGVSRQIRSDEWAILTPMTWTQYMDPNGHFSYFNSVIRAESTDVFLEYGLPIYTPLMVFKPFLLGYLFLPIAKGMAFFWCGRLIALTMVCFEFGRFITNDKRMLSIVYSVMIVFSPPVQWWFAINGFVEMLIFFQLSLISFDRYLKDDNSRKRLLYATVIGICAGGYVLTMYPGWMIPLAYVLLACIIWVFVDNCKKGTIKRLHRIDFLPIMLVICILTVSAVYIYSNSHETISTLANTIYPGQRSDNGGAGTLKHLFSFIPCIWYAVRVVGEYEGIFNNVCDSAQFICLFPAGYLLFLYRLIKGKRDTLCTAMVIVSIFLMIYCIVGLPGSVANITALNYSVPHRVIVIWGLANVILLVRLVALISEDREEPKTEETSGDESAKKITAYIFMCAIAIVGIWEAYRLNATYYDRYMPAAEAIVFIPLYVLLCNHSKRIKTVWGVLMIAVCLASTGLANPVRMGVDDVKKSPDVQMIQAIVEKDPEAVWIAEGEGFPSGNLPLLAGAKTINCTNIYPDLERWRKIDPEGAYEDCYNRYAAAIQVIRHNDNVNDQKFVLHNELSYTVHLSDEDMEKIGVKYIISAQELTGDKTKLVSSNGIHNVYVLN